MKRRQNILKVAPSIPAEEIGYWRVSTGRDQIPDMQIDALKRRGISEDNIFGDTASGRKAKRPGLEMALKAMRKGDALVVWKLDRLGRDTMELLRLEKELDAEGQMLISMTELLDTRTAMGRAFFSMLATFAQFESDTTAERSRAGVAQARRNGSRVGAPSKLTPKQFQQMETLLLSKRAKTLSLNAIARRFRVSVALINLRFPSWRGKTIAQRKAWRRSNPLPKN